MLLMWAFHRRPHHSLNNPILASKTVFQAFSTQRESPLVYLENIFSTATHDLLEKKGLQTPFTTVVSTTNRKYGSDDDYQCNVALSLAKSLKKNPRDLAEELCKIVSSSKNNGISRIHVSGPGFLNVKLDDRWIYEQIVDVTVRATQPIRPTKSSKKILIDFGSPNMGKELHVGHLRSSVIGDTLANLFEFRGNYVTRVSHVGDWGSAMATSIAQMMDTEPFRQKLLTEEYLDNEITPHDLNKIYQIGKSRLKSEEDFKKKVDEIVLELQKGKEGSKLVRNAWHSICTWSRRGFDSIFERLQVRVQERGESFYGGHLAHIVEEMTQNGFVKEKDGAKCIFINGEDASPMIIQKKDGGYLYPTVDLAALKLRSQEHDWIIYVTDRSQELHFTKLFNVGKLTGWYDPSKVRLDHVAFGLVKGDSGTKISSREGNTTSLKFLLDRVVEETQVAFQRNSSSSSSSLKKTEEHFLKHSIGNSAVRYFELSHQRDRDYQFALNKVLDRKGNTSIYLLYARARLQALLNKYNQNQNPSSPIQWKEYVAHLKSPDSCSFKWDSSSERQLALVIMQFPDVLNVVEKQLRPHFLCEYLYLLCTKFHSFYECCPILNHPRQVERIMLCATVGSVLDTGLELLGIPLVNQM